MKYVRIFFKSLAEPITQPGFMGRTLVGALFYALGMWLLGYNHDPNIFWGVAFVIAANNAWRS